MEPVDEAGIWAPILANPLDSPPPSHTIPLLREVEDYFNYVYKNYGMEIDHCIEKPQDKLWRDQSLGVFIPKENWSCGPRSSCKRKILPSNNNYAMSFDHFQDKPRRDQYLEEFISKENWVSRGPRASRKRRIYTLNRRKWDQHAVIKLVEGVKKYGLRQWPEVKRHYFFPSFREPELFREPKQLQDKWRNLLIACKVLLNSKGKAQTEMYFPLDRWVIKRIRRLAKSLRLGIYK